jgi:hypothetical protein
MYVRTQNLDFSIVKYGQPKAAENMNASYHSLALFCRYPLGIGAALRSMRWYALLHDIGAWDDLDNKGSYSSCCASNRRSDSPRQRIHFSLQILHAGEIDPSERHVRLAAWYIWIAFRLMVRRSTIRSNIISIKY